MKKSVSQLSFSANSKKPPKKPKNTDRRSREYLTNLEVEQLRRAYLERIGKFGNSINFYSGWIFAFYPLEVFLVNVSNFRKFGLGISTLFPQLLYSITKFSSDRGVHNTVLWNGVLILDT